MQKSEWKRGSLERNSSRKKAAFGIWAVIIVALILLIIVVAGIFIKKTPNVSHYESLPQIINFTIVNSSTDSFLKTNNESENRIFEKTEVGNTTAYFYQRVIDSAIVENNNIIYQVNNETGQIISKTEEWRTDLPEHLPVELISKEQAEQIAGGEIQFSNLYYLSPDSVVFPINYTKNPCWVVQSLKNNNTFAITVIDAINGSIVGEGIPPPYTAFASSGAYTAQCDYPWTNWYQNAQSWFNNMGYSTETAVFPNKDKFKSQISSTDVAVLYEVGHSWDYTGYSFASGCDSQQGQIIINANYDISNWIKDYSKMRFVFLASCYSLCDTGPGTLSYEFRKGSNNNTAIVGYCGMGDQKCANCWTQTVSWQNTLFSYMYQGYTVRQAFDMTNPQYPSCYNNGCIRFVGDDNFKIYPTVSRDCSCTWQTNSCGGNGCRSYEKSYSAKSCNYNDCPTTKCVKDSSCGEGFEISNCEQLSQIRNDLQADYILTSDIDCSNFTGFQPIDNFEGNLDGKGYAVTGLNIAGIGLFSSISRKASIKNIGLINVQISGQDNVGGLVGYNNGIIEKSYISSGKISGNSNVGGIIGQNLGVIKDSYSKINVSGSSNIGGIIGLNNGNVTSCYSMGDIEGSSSVGGLAGFQKGLCNGESYQGCASDNYSCLNSCGGSAWHPARITNSYATGKVEGSSFSGGIVGNNLGTIFNSYWNNKNDGINSCYSTEQTFIEIADYDSCKSKGQSCELVQYCTEEYDGFCFGYWNYCHCSFSGDTGCTAIQNNESYFYNPQSIVYSSWDFTNVWDNVNYGRGYPPLKWQKMLVDRMPPNISLISPNNTQAFVSTRDIIFNISASDDIGIQNCTLFVDDISGLEHYTETNIRSGSCNSLPFEYQISNSLCNSILGCNYSESWDYSECQGTFSDYPITQWKLSNLKDNSYSWNARCCDNSNNCAFANKNSTFDIEYCISNLINSTWSNWASIGTCSIKDLLNESRNFIQYDSNHCRNLSASCNPYKLLWPLNCTPGNDCRINNYPDMNSDGIADSILGFRNGISGHQGTDIDISFQQMDKGVDVFAALDGEVLWVFDGRYDRCEYPNTNNPDCKDSAESDSPGLISKTGFKECTNLGPYCANGDPASGNCFLCFNDGNMVIIKHSNPEGIFITEYGHLKNGSINVKPGDYIKRGQKIGEVGSSGRSTNPHLHFDIWKSYGSSPNFVIPELDPWNQTKLLWENTLPWTIKSTCKDAYQVIDQTFFEYREISCNYCSFNVTNSSWSNWAYQTNCLSNDTQIQNRSRITYDSNYASCYNLTRLDSDLWNNGTNLFFWEFNKTSCDYCIPNWTQINTSCQINDLLTSYYLDLNNCYAQTNLYSDKNSYENKTYTCNYCSYNLTNTTWTDWQSAPCSIENIFRQNRSSVEYDSNYNSCYIITLLSSDLWNNGNNVTNWQFRNLTCDYCTPNLINTTWSEWNNLSCSQGKMNQSRFLMQYDNNFCGEIENQTFFEYQLVNPDYQNSSWSDWTNVSCLLGDVMNQSRNLTQFDSYNCASSQVSFEYRANETCDYCTPNLVNTTWTEWANMTECFKNNTLMQIRNLTQYDNNSCGEVNNQTFSESRAAPCYYECGDTDKGLNYYLEGSIKNSSDSCLSQNGLYLALQEFYCNNEGDTKSINYSCPYGCAVENGIVLGKCAGDGSILQCGDSDNGKNYYAKGNVTAGNFVRRDFCEMQSLTSSNAITGGVISIESVISKIIGFVISGYAVTEINSNTTGKLFEWYCENNTFQAESYNCPFGCQDGKCLEGCSDSDSLLGLNDSYYVRGVLNGIESGIEVKREDYCLTSNQLGEYICDNSLMPNANYKITNFSCPYGCNNGVCQACSENWNCTEWRDCFEEEQVRTCTDLNGCGTNSDKPRETKSCAIIVECAENWSCTDWDECTNGTQARTCTDANNCGTILNKPNILKNCIVWAINVSSPPAIVESKSQTEKISVRGIDVTIQKYPDVGMNTIKSEKSTASTRLETTVENNNIYLKTSKGESELKLLPQEALSKIDKLDKVQTMSIKEEQSKLIYSVSGTKNTQLFFIIPLSADIRAKINAQTGEVIQYEKPWWRFFALGI